MFTLVSGLNTRFFSTSRRTCTLQLWMMHKTMSIRSLFDAHLSYSHCTQHCDQPMTAWLSNPDLGFNPRRLHIHEAHRHLSTPVAGACPVGVEGAQESKCVPNATDFPVLPCFSYDIAVNDRTWAMFPMASVWVWGYPQARPMLSPAKRPFSQGRRVCSRWPSTCHRCCRALQWVQVWG